MPAKRTSRGILSRAVVPHLLCLVVFLFALQAKLAVYKTSPEPSVTASKLTIEKNPTRGLSAIGKREPIKGRPEFRFYIIQFHSLYKCPLPILVDHSARIALVASARLDDHGSSYFNRPPPILL